MLVKSFFAKWFKSHGRSFPWRREGTTPFEFLVTEMLLRQTRADAVAKLWDSVVRRYPDAKTMASADYDELASQLKVLGFSNLKATSLKAASAWLVEKHDGQVPETLEELMKIPHVGEYTAQAVLCFAFGHKLAIVDNNILRFFARYLGLNVKPDIRRNPVIWEIAQKAMPRERRKAQQHNYGILDFTAQICQPVWPRCNTCPLRKTCHYPSVQAAQVARITSLRN